MGLDYRHLLKIILVENYLIKYHYEREISH